MTKEIPAGVSAYLDSIDNADRKADCETLFALFSKVTQMPAKMWGNIVGFGNYHYVYESGREGDAPRTGFANRKASLSIYIMPGYTDFSEILSRLGKHSKGKACLYVKRLSDVDLEVLAELIAAGIADMQEKYPE